MFWVRNNAKNVDSKRKKPKSREEEENWMEENASSLSGASADAFFETEYRELNCRTDSIQIERDEEQKPPSKSK